MRPTGPRPGSRYPAEYLTDPDIADEIAVVSKTVANAQILLQRLETAAASDGLTINQSKTKAMITGLDDKPTEQKRNH